MVICCLNSINAKSGAIGFFTIIEAINGEFTHLASLQYLQRSIYDRNSILKLVRFMFFIF